MRVSTPFPFSIGKTLHSGHIPDKLVILWSALYMEYITMTHSARPGSVPGSFAAPDTDFAQWSAPVNTPTRRSSTHSLIQRRNLGSDVYRVLRDRILRQELHAGEKLSDLRLSNELGVSRTPIREALLQ